MWPVPEASPQWAAVGALSELGLEGSREADGDRLCMFLWRASPIEPSSEFCLMTRADLDGGSGAWGWVAGSTGRDPVLLPAIPAMLLSTNRGQGDLRKR